MAYSVLWLAAVIVFILIECVSYQLMSIWMAAGALVALVANMFGFTFIVQFMVFIVVSIILIVFTRPLAKKLINARNIKTNVDSIIGKKALVTEDILNIENKGTVKIGGMEWSARADEKIQKGEIVKVLRVEGVKVIVEKGE